MKWEVGGSATVEVNDLEGGKKVRLTLTSNGDRRSVAGFPQSGTLVLDNGFRVRLERVRNVAGVKLATVVVISFENRRQAA